MLEILGVGVNIFNLLGFIKQLEGHTKRGWLIKSDIKSNTFLNSFFAPGVTDIIGLSH